jgi:hypothetical protein
MCDPVSNRWIVLKIPFRYRVPIRGVVRLDVPHQLVPHWLSGARD